MEPKKNPKQVIEKKASLYFMTGLMLILALVYVALEWKVYESNNYEISLLDAPDYLEEEVPITIHQQPPPPPKIIAPAVIEIAPDDTNVIESAIKSTESNQETETLNIEEIEFEEEEEDVTLIIDLIDEVPVFPGCEDAKDKKACFQKMMTKHVNRTIKYPDLAIELNIEGRVSTQFIIGKNGAIENVKMRGPHQVLEKEAARILAKLPKMTPGKHKGKNAKVVFSMPINFQIQ